MGLLLQLTSHLLKLESVWEVSNIIKETTYCLCMLHIGID